MKQKIPFSSVLLAAMFLIVGTGAHASNLWFADGVHGNDQNDCRTPQTACKTIGHAISLASSGDAVSIAAAVYPEHNLTVGFDLRLLASGFGVATPTIDGGAANRVLTISSGAHVTLFGLTIRDGSGPPHFPSFGSGIYNLGTLTVTNCTITGNHADYGAGIFNQGARVTINNTTISGNGEVSGRHASGAGLFNANGGTVTINNSILNGNDAYQGDGGGIYNGATMTINNSTVTGNFASQGGGIASLGGQVTVNNVTVSNNSATSIGGLYSGANGLTAQNSIVANNSGGNCSGGVVSAGYNLSSDSTCNFHQAGDLNNTNPLLGPLQNNGGPTQTQALLEGSPAIDAGNPSGCTDGNGHLPRTDQRGQPRPDHEDSGGCDMGAYERQTD